MALRGGNHTTVDQLTLLYNSLLTAILLLFAWKLPSWHSLILINLAMIGFIVLLVPRINSTSSGIFRLLRNFYPLLFFFPAYEQTGRMNRVLFDRFLDPFFQNIEQLLFGFQPAIAFARAFPHAWLVELMHTAYFSYYLMFPSLGLILYLRRQNSELIEYLFSLCATFYLCCLIYICLPVIGAISFSMEPFNNGGLFTWIMKLIYKNCEVGGAAFPSSHVAVSAVVLYYAFKYVPKAAPFYAIAFAGITLSTVYCRYHYAIDVIAGIATAAIMLLMARRLMQLMQRTVVPKNR